MFGNREATVVRLTPFGLHGVTYVDVVLRFDDGSQDSARLGPEGVPLELAVGERVTAVRVANMVVSLARPS